MKLPSIESPSKKRAVALVLMGYSKGPTMLCRVIPVARILRAQGMDCALFALSEAFPGQPEEISWEGETIHLMGQAHFTLTPQGEKVRFSVLRYSSEIRRTFCRLLRRFRCSRPDLVHIFTADPGSLLISLGLRIAGYRVALDMDDSVYGMAVLAGYPKWVCWAQRFLEETIPRLLPWVTVYSLPLAQRLRHAIHIPNAVSTACYRREAPACSGPRRTVIWASTMGPPQRHLRVIDLIPEIIRKDPQIRFCLVGDGEYFSAVRKKIDSLGLGEKIEFTGRLSREDGIRRMCRADIGICPVDQNPFDRVRLPMKLLDYMAAGLTIVTAAVGEIPRVIRHLENGWLYRAGDMEDLTRGILWVSSQPALAQRLASRAREDVRRYDADLIAPRWLAFYHKAAGWNSR